MKTLLAAIGLAGVLVSSLAPTAEAQMGSWNTVKNWPPPADGKLAIHASLLPTGNVIFYAGSGGSGDQTPTYLWDPVADTVVQTSNLAPSNMFCGGHSHLADGRLLAIGGTMDPCGTTAATNAFNPSTGLWSSVDAMNQKRWYATATTLSDGRVLATMGNGADGDADDLPEIYNPATNLWTSLPCPDPQPCPAKKHLALYPFMFVLPNGKLFAAGAPESTAPTPLTTYTLDLGTNTWTTVDDSIADGGSAVMYRPGLVMKSGGGPNPEQTPAVKTTEWIDMTTGPSSWTQSADMVFARFHQNFVLLPDGTVLAVGGSSQGCDHPVLAAELWNPTSKTWTEMASMTNPRMYHSTALLLPDGRVFSSGSGGEAACVDQPSYQVYSPPYLSAGTPATVNPATPTTMGYSTGFTVTLSKPAGTTVTSVALLRPGATTHAFDQNQRYVPLTITGSTTTTVTVSTPQNANTAPPGKYMLFLVLNTGRPSVAYWVTVA
jgi:Domain of unknown function (DUF1929)